MRLTEAVQNAANLPEKNREECAFSLLRTFPLKDFGRRLNVPEKLEEEMAFLIRVSSPEASLEERARFINRRDSSVLEGDVEAELQEIAASINDFVCSFPGFYSRETTRPPFAEPFLDYIDEGKEMEASEEEKTPFFYKQIAGFVQGNPATWAECAAAWGSSREERSGRLLSFVESLSLSGMLEKMYEPAFPSHSISLRDWMDGETLASFEAVIGYELSDELRARFKEELKNEAVRYAVVFHLTQNFFPGQYMQCKARQWLKAAVWVAQLQQHYELPEERWAEMFAWALDSVELSEIDAGGGDLKQALDWCNKHTADEYFSKHAASILLGIAKWEAFEVNFNGIIDWGFCDISSEALKGMILDQVDLTEHRECAEWVHTFLTEVGSSGKSELYLKAVQNSKLDEAYFARAKELLASRVEVSVSEALCTLLNVSKGWSAVIDLYPGGEQDISQRVYPYKFDLGRYERARKEQSLWAFALALDPIRGPLLEEKKEVIAKVEAFVGGPLPQRVLDEICDDRGSFEGLIEVIEELTDVRAEYIETSIASPKVPDGEILFFQDRTSPFLMRELPRQLTTHAANVSTEPRPAGVAIVNLLSTSFVYMDNDLFEGLKEGREEEVWQPYGEEGERKFCGRWVDGAFELKFREGELEFGVRVPIEREGYDCVELEAQCNLLLDRGESTSEDAFCTALVVGARKALFRLVCDKESQNPHLDDPNQFKVDYGQAAASTSEPS